MIKLLYCSPAFAFAIPTFPIMILLPQIYVTDHGLTLSSIGIILFLAKIIDIFSDPLMGWICDRNFLSRKNWIIIGSLISGTAFYNLILPIAKPDAFYLFIWISLLYIGYTIFQVAYLSIGYDLEHDYEKRSKLSAGREFFVILGLLVSVSLPVLFNEKNIDSEIFLLFLAISSGGTTILLFSLFFQEKKSTKENDHEMFFSLKELRGNEYLSKILSPWFFNSLANAFPMILFVFYVTSILEGKEEDKELILFLYFLSALIGMIFWVILIKKTEKNNIWRLSMFCSALVFLYVFFLDSGDIFLFSVISCLTGFCLGADLAIPPSMLSDVTDFHKRKFQKDISGLLFSFLILISKITFAIATLIAFSLLDLFEYSADGDNSENSKYLLIFLYAGIPVILKILTVIRLKNFDLTKKAMDKIRKNLYY